MSAPSRARSFGAAAGSYDANRPGYPRAAIEWALGASPLRVADLGAGTGILSRALAESGHQVVSVEPDHAMLSRLRRADPSAAGLLGAAERIPLSDAAVDAVLSGQAYHWFDAQSAHPEIARVLRPRGRFAALWNIEDTREPWVAELARRWAPITGYWSERERIMTSWPYPDTAPHFTEPERGIFDHAVTMTADSLLAMLRTHSVYLVADEARKARMDGEVRDLVDTHPALVGRDAFPVPYRTVVYRMRAFNG